jgi:hypothetical protein
MNENNQNCEVKIQAGKATVLPPCSCWYAYTMDQSSQQVPHELCILQSNHILEHVSRALLMSTYQYKILMNSYRSYTLIRKFTDHENGLESVLVSYSGTANSYADFRSLCHPYVQIVRSLPKDLNVREANNAVW